MDASRLIIGRGFVGRSLHAELGWLGSPIGAADALASPQLLNTAAVVVFASGTKAIQACESDPGMAAEKNMRTPAMIARMCGGVFIYISTDYVFDGTRGGYVPGDAPNPKTAYGVSKTRGEDAVLAANPLALVVRTAHLMATGCPWIEWLVTTLAEGHAVDAWEDRYNTPTSIAHLADGISRALRLNATGIIHVVGSRRVSRLELFRSIAEIRGLDASQVVPSACDSPFVPRDLSLLP